MLRRSFGFSQGLKITQSPVAVLTNEGEGLKSEGKEAILPTEAQPNEQCPRGHHGSLAILAEGQSHCSRSSLLEQPGRPALQWELKALAPQLFPPFRRNTTSSFYKVSNSGTPTWIQPRDSALSTLLPGVN